jgi:DNA-binding response OmpR family regulator
MTLLQILCLEDDVSLRNAMQETFAFIDPDLHVQLCATVEQSQRVLGNDVNRYDLFLIDIHISGSVSGLDFARWLRHSGCTSIIALMSAYQRPRLHIMEGLDCRWMPKPLSADGLLELIDFARSARSV